VGYLREVPRVTARQWAVAVAVAGVVTTAAFFSPAIMLATLSLMCALLGVHRMARWRYLVARQREIEVNGPRIDAQALMGTVANMDTLHSRYWSLPAVRREGFEGTQIIADIRRLKQLAHAQYEGVELPMPIVQPFTKCPSCDVKGAHLAELDASGTAWRRKCWECDHLWTEA
jgi:hypothetical protein